MFHVQMGNRNNNSNKLKSAIVAVGLFSFVLSKKSIDQHRYENMKVRERMRNANSGQYPASERKFTG